MNDKNFDSLKNLKAPDSWIENALNIPNVCEKKPIFFIRYSRSLVAVACLVLVCTISLLVVLNKGDSPVLVVDPSVEAMQDETSKSETQAQAFENATEKDDDKIKNPAIENQGENGDAPHESTENPTQSQDSNQQSTTQKPVETPTEKQETPTDAPEILPVPTVKPTRPPSIKPEIKPVNKPNYPDDPIAPPPTDGAPALPGVPGIPQDDVTFSLVVDSYFLTSGEYIYCNIISPDEEVVVTNVIAQISSYSNKALASITLSSEYFLVSGEYTCYFYSSNGYYIGNTCSYV